MIELRFEQEFIRLTREILDAFLAWGAENQASDLVLRSDQGLVAKIHGRYLEVHGKRISATEIFDLINEIYVQSAHSTLLGGEDINFRYEVRLDRRRRASFRGNATAVHPYHGVGAGIEIVFRTIPDVPPSVEDLELEPVVLEHAFPENGMVLAVGPTGSGKSTLLAALMRVILSQEPAKHVVTYEAPIEFNLGRVPNRTGIVAQSEIPRHLPSFAAGVANALRRAPDVVMVGEMRDMETIEGGVTASQTGHAIYSTLHTYSASGIVWRMADLFPVMYREPVAYKILDALRLGIYQRLVPAKAGGRIALREVLPFTEAVRNDLTGHVSDPGAFFERCRFWLQACGQSLAMDFERKADRIEPGWRDRLYREIHQEPPLGAERQR